MTVNAATNTTGTVTPAKAERYTCPTEYANTYTAEHIDDLRVIYAWLNRQEGITKEWLATATGYPSGTIASVLSGKYNANPGKHLGVARKVIARHDERQAKGIDDDRFIETSTYKLAQVVCDRARTYRNFGVLSAYVGTGKTTALKHYAHDNAGTILIEADPSMTSSTLLDEIMEQANVPPVGASRDKKIRAIIRALKGSDRLIILDEAEKCSVSDKSNNALEFLRRISDKAGIGVVLAGTERLYALIAPEGVFGQIRSRAPIIIPVIKSITKDDAAMLVNNSLPQADSDTIQTIWSLCRGSARMLCEGLIPAIKDYGIAQDREITPALVLAIAKQVMALIPSKEAAQ